MKSDLHSAAQQLVQARRLDSIFFIVVHFLEGFSRAAIQIPVLGACYFVNQISKWRNSNEL